jgi:hypothetical protein
MATRSRIAIETQDGIISIYCHWMVISKQMVKFCLKTMIERKQNNSLL